MTTIRDVARAAGVSVATVSRVLNNPHTVREPTRVRVQQVIADLRYHPNPTARRLSIGRTFTIGVILPFLTRPSFVERLRGVEAALSHSAYDLVVSNVESLAKRDAYFEAIVQGRRFDGNLIMTLAPTNAEAQVIHETGLPVVLVDTSHPLLPGVDVDDEGGGRMVAAYLLAKGHRRLAFLGDVEYDWLLTSSAERLVGYEAGLRESGVALAEADRFWVPPSRRAARSVIDLLLARPPTERPTAIFATSDTTALGLLDGLRQRGLRAPDDLAVVGFDDLDVAESYDLTTVHQKLFQSGVRGIEMLLTLLESGQPSTPTRLLLPLTLVERGTT